MQMISGLDLKRKDYFIEKLFFLLPISIILGNFALNIISVLIALVTLLIFVEKKIVFKYKNFYIFGVLFIIFLIVNIINSQILNLSIKNSLGILKYFIMFMGLVYCLDNIKNFKKKFSFFILICTAFVIIDSSIQFIFGRDIFNYEIINNRLTGPFGTEKVVGSFISKMFFLSLIFFYEEKSSKFLIFIFFFFSILLTFLSQERSASIMLFL